MSRFIVRCNKCRTRHTFPKAPEAYKRPPKCRVTNCGSTRFYMDKERTLRVPCRCSGAYHWGAHRKGSPMCIFNPRHLEHRARRQGLDDDDLALAGVLGTQMAPGVPIPF
jgi:hypothetical protein